MITRSCRRIAIVALPWFFASNALVAGPINFGNNAITFTAPTVFHDNGHGHDCSQQADVDEARGRSLGRRFQLHDNGRHDCQGGNGRTPLPDLGSAAGWGRSRR